ncbi:tubulin nucleotide-binding domain-like protein [Wallemia mellicola]|uniref:Tubulin nucleotide-binding domain-like protein n=1 Tax=Wallemia mellicola TaxID=1708541 RepID=A0A4T0Q1B6_9BASI|nr:hypothetical protein E3Q23_00444 [Wallemia mellicola]TIB81777.1 tubulin nucleotide-binding domain-like protein [Wallemia mellicola]TIC15327.1 tubulin nucleotide-binding domain-like protein [Wallemia mellicola]TIC16748.1 tubulin nucleotide-binding domain-like protein [Wallemia mellicola]TIC51530.1 tubulin nucleotide-binding domain-like protein [Wallemia mellicola]
MHEIVHLSFGNSSAYSTVQYFNQQEFYFSQEDADQQPIDHDVSYRVGEGYDGSETYVPRLLLYDLKSNFGSIKRVNELYEQDRERDSTFDSVSGFVDVSFSIGLTQCRQQIEYHQQPIGQKSRYQEQLDKGEDPAAPTNDEVRSWTDFNRSYFHPRSIHQIPSFVQSGSTLMEDTGGLVGFDGFELGQDVYKDYEREHYSFDEDLRHFAEECDLLQGFHVNADISDAWSGFSSAYLEEVRETYAKTPIMVFGHERDHLAPWKASRKYEDIEDDVKHPLSSVLRMNEMLALSRLEAVCDMVIPLSCPTTWRNDYNLKLDSLFVSSSILNPHIDATSLPLKLFNGGTNIQQLSSQLNWRGGTKIVSLCGAVGGTLDAFDYSGINSSKENDVFAQMDVVRPPYKPNQEKLEEKLDSRTKLRHPLISRYWIDKPAYALHPSHSKDIYKDDDLSTLSTLLTSDAVRSKVEEHGKLAESFPFKYGGLGSGLSRDEMIELAEQFWRIHSSYNSDPQFGELDLSDSLGSEGEYELDD